MKMQSFFKKYAVLSLITLIITGSCNDDKETGTVPPTGDTGKIDKVINPPAATLLSGNLDTLYVDSLAFTALKGDQTVFAFYIGSSDTLTLHGWKGKGLCKTGYDPVPDIRLNNGGSTSVSYGQGTYLGNVILDKDQVKKIIKILKDNDDAHYVLFVPQPRAGSEFIKYKIFITDDDPSRKTIKPLVVIDPNEETNPSPPKN